MNLKKIRLDVLKELASLKRAGEKSFLREMVSIYLESSENRVQRIKERYKQKDFESIGKEAHALKSSSYRIGAYDLAASCQDLETLCNQNAEEAALQPIIEQTLSEHLFAKEELAKLMTGRQIEGLS